MSKTVQGSAFTQHLAYVVLSQMIFVAVLLLVSLIPLIVVTIAHVRGRVAVRVLVLTLACFLAVLAGIVAMMVLSGTAAIACLLLVTMRKGA